MQVFCKKTLHIINADCRKGNACITVFPELRKEFQRGAKAFRGVCPGKAQQPRESPPHGAFPSENTILMHVHATGRAGTPSESPIRFVNFAALELIQG